MNTITNNNIAYYIPSETDIENELEAMLNSRETKATIEEGGRVACDEPKNISSNKLNKCLTAETKACNTKSISKHKNSFVGTSSMNTQKFPFPAQLSIGQVGEAIALNVLRDMYKGAHINYVAAQVPEPGTHPADIIVTKADGTVLKCDVKHDTASATSGNLCIEKKGLLEAIKEGVDTFIYVHYDKAGTCYVRFVSTDGLYEKLLDLVREGTVKTLHAGNKNAKGAPNPCALVPVSFLDATNCPIKNKVFAILKPETK